jgi:hypothetical protein
MRLKHAQIQNICPRRRNIAAFSTEIPRGAEADLGRGFCALWFDPTNRQNAALADRISQ